VLGWGFIVFEKHREKKAQEDYQNALAKWQAERDGQAAALEFAKTTSGDTTTSELMLKKGEAVFAKITSAGLVELRRGPGQWQGRSQGVSIPVGSLAGRSVRYRVGASKGHYVQGEPHPTAIDTGTAFITNQRVVFKGSSQSRECLFTKLLGYDLNTDGSATFSVSNRQKPTTIQYGTKLNSWVQIRLELALAQYRDDVSALIERLQNGLTEIDAEKPQQPAPIAPGT
jgi:hypothetical protein